MCSLTWKHICQRKTGQYQFSYRPFTQHLVLNLFMCFCVCVFRLYLNLVLGNVNVTLLSNQAKYVKYSAPRTAGKHTYRLDLCVDFSSSSSRSFPQICLQRRVWKVQALYDDNPDVWSNNLPLLSQLSVRELFPLKRYCFRITNL